MNKEKLESLMRHIFTAIMFILPVVGLGEYLGVVEILNENLAVIFNAYTAIAGLALSIWKVFQKEERFVAVSEYRVKQAAMKAAQ